MATEVIDKETAAVRCRELEELSRKCLSPTENDRKNAQMLLAMAGKIRKEWNLTGAPEETESFQNQRDIIERRKKELAEVVADDTIDPDQTKRNERTKRHLADEIQARTKSFNKAQGALSGFSSLPENRLKALLAHIEEYSHPEGVKRHHQKELAVMKAQVTELRKLIAKNKKEDKGAKES